MRGLGILLALVFALLASACGGSEPTAEQVPPGAIVLAASKTNEAGTYKADITGAMDIAGQSVDMSGTGEFDGAQQRGHMSYTMSLNGQDVDMEMVFAYPAIYMQFPPEAGPLPGGKTWVKMDLEKLGQQAGFDFDQIMQVGQSDPSQGLDFLRGATGVQAVGDEDVRGVHTTHYTGVVDLRSLGTKYPEMKPSIDQLVEQTGISRVPVEVWIDGTQLGQVSPGRRSALVADGGERTLCLLVPGAAQCGDRGTVREVYLHDGWSVTMHCLK